MASGDDPRVGFDPNGTSWLVFRYPSDWSPPAASGRAPPIIDGVYYDPLREVVSLAPLAPSSVDAFGQPLKDWLPLNPVTDDRGDAWRSDPASARVLRRRACETEFTPLPCFGGAGWEVGKLDAPAGLAVGADGLLYVCDAGNHRVQIVRPEDGTVAFVLGRVDGWGRPLAGTTAGAMTEPVDVAIDPTCGKVFVADRAGGRVHVFDRRYRWLRSFAPQTDVPRPTPVPPRPVAVAVAADGTLLIADASWPRLLHATAGGQVLPEVALSTVSDPHFAGLELRVRYPESGDAIIGPLDGLVYDTSWHRVAVAADVAPGTAIEVQTFAANDNTIAIANMDWAPAAPVRIPQAGELADDDGEYQRLVLPDTARWTRQVHGPYRAGQPVLARFPLRIAGVPVPGPSGARTQALPDTALQVVRAGDGVTFSKPAGTTTATIQSIAPLTVELFASADAAVYAAGATLALTSRAGEPLAGGARVLYVLGAGELIDLTQADLTGGASRIDLPQGAAALLREGDAWTLTDGTHNTGLVIASVSFTRLELSLTADPLAGGAQLYTAGAQLLLLGAGGVPRPGGPALVYQLSAGDATDLSGLATGALVTQLLPVAVAAALGPNGDYRFKQGLVSIDVHVAGVATTQARVTFSAPVAGDFSTSTMQLTAPAQLATAGAPRRLVATDLAGFESVTTPGETITVTDGVSSATALVLLAEADTGVVWLPAAALPGPAVTVTTWRWFTTVAAVATDRGRYLWLKLRLFGRKQHPADPFSVETPAVNALRILLQRPSYLRLLPGAFSQRNPLNDPAGALFLERFLALFEGELTSIESRYETFSRLLDPDAAPPEWLAWIASWLDLVFDPSWTLDKRRTVVKEAAQLYHQRGTIAGLTRWLEIYTGSAPVIIETFRLRTTPGMVIGQSARLGCARLLDDCTRTQLCATGYADRFAHRFTIWAQLDDACDRQLTEGVLRALIDALKPAHTEYQLKLVLPNARVGLQSTIGVDFVLGRRGKRQAILGLTSDPDRKGGMPIIGRGLVVRRDRAGRGGDAIAIGPESRVGDGFALK